MDKDGSGEISLDELKEVFGVKDDKEAEKSLKEIIDKIDKDGNGQISIQEYSDMMKNIINQIKFVYIIRYLSIELIFIKINF